MSGSFIETLIKAWPQLGASGALFLALCLVIWYMNRHIERREKEHREERGEWRKQAETQNATMRGQTDTMIQVAQNSTTALTELSTLIKSRTNL